MRYILGFSEFADYYRLTVKHYFVQTLTPNLVIMG